MFNYSFRWNQAFQSLPDMLQGALVTLEVAVLSMILGILFAIVLTAFRLSGNRLLRGITTTWVEVARNTPALFQIYMAFFGLAGLGIAITGWTQPHLGFAVDLRLSPYVALLAGITFNNAGYLHENFRGALKAIPDTQTRSARSLGMSAPQAFGYVVMPQMLRISFLPMTNQFVWAILMTSLGAVISMNSDLFGVTDNLVKINFRTFEMFALAAVIFYVMTKVVTLSARLVAVRLFRQ